MFKFGNLVVTLMSGVTECGCHTELMGPERAPVPFCPPDTAVISALLLVLVQLLHFGVLLEVLEDLLESCPLNLR
jgi:hypothetical protein